MLKRYAHVYGLLICTFQSEAIRFEKAIVTSASADGGPGVVRLPGVEEAMEAVGAAPGVPPASDLEPFS